NPRRPEFRWSRRSCRSANERYSAVESGFIRTFQSSRSRRKFSLRQEHVNVERRPVNRPATEQDVRGLKEGSIEVRETAEEPVVTKQARVVEEVVVSKEVAQENRKVADTVRRSHVDVDENPATSLDKWLARRMWAG